MIIRKQDLFALLTDAWRFAGLTELHRHYRHQNADNGKDRQRFFEGLHRSCNGSDVKRR